MNKKMENVFFLSKDTESKSKETHYRRFNNFDMWLYFAFHSYTCCCFTDRITLWGLIKVYLIWNMIIFLHFYIISKYLWVIDHLAKQAISSQHAGLWLTEYMTNNLMEWLKDKWVDEDAFSSPSVPWSARRWCCRTGRPSSSSQWCNPGRAHGQRGFATDLESEKN